MKRWILTLCVWIAAVAWALPCIARPVDEGAPREADSLPLEPGDRWVVVDLFTGRSASEQALRIKKTLERLGARGEGMVLSFRRATLEEMARIRPTFLALSPNGIPWCRYTGENGEGLERFFAALRAAVDRMKVPVIGICGGHQALALAFGGKVGPIVGEEDDCFPYGNHPTEKGRKDLELLEDDPLFESMESPINLVQSHYDEVKRLPPGFLWLAKNELSPYQIIRHPQKPVYGVQAHTEYYHRHRPDGGTLLRNFLRIVEEHNAAERRGAGGDGSSASMERLKVAIFSATPCPSLSFEAR